MVKGQHTKGRYGKGSMPRENMVKGQHTHQPREGVHGS